MGELRFCPFCREAFDDETLCPEHELELVPWLALPSARRVSHGDGPLPWYSPRLGRGWLAAGALITLGAFLSLSLARVEGEAAMGGQMLSLATSGRSPRLWLVPAAAVAQLLLLGRRRTPAAMRGARLAALLLALVPALTVAWTLSGVEAAVALLAERSGRALTVTLGAGAVAIWLATPPMLYGSSRLGVEPPPRL